MMRHRREFLIRSAAVSVSFLDSYWNPSVPAFKEDVEGDIAKLITPTSRKAIDAGLRFLVANQSADGSFGSRGYAGNVGITSLAALAFVSAGHRLEDDASGKNISKALDFVLSQQKQGGPQDGYLHKHGWVPASGMYDHAFATLFLAHLHGKIKGKEASDKVEASLSRAIKLIVTSQNKEGGWRYFPTSKDADVSVTCCQMLALAAARQAGVEVPKETTEAGVNYIKKCFDPDSGSFHYIAGEQTPNNEAFARTAAAAAVLQAHGMCGANEVDKALIFLVKNRPVPGPRADLHYFYGHYYAAMALRAYNVEAWKKWFSAVNRELVDRQDRNGSWHDMVDPFYATAMACMVLLAPEGRLAIKTEKKRKE